MSPLCAMAPCAVAPACTHLSPNVLEGETRREILLLDHQRLGNTLHVCMQNRAEQIGLAAGNSACAMSIAVLHWAGFMSPAVLCMLLCANVFFLSGHALAYKSNYNDLTASATYTRWHEIAESTRPVQRVHPCVHLLVCARLKIFTTRQYCKSNGLRCAIRDCSWALATRLPLA